MKGYLVLVRCGSDDVPVRLCEKREQADAIALALQLQSVKKAESRFQMDVSSYHCVAVVAFGDSGYVETVEIVRDFDDEPDCEFPDGSQYDVIEAAIAKRKTSA